MKQYWNNVSDLEIEKIFGNLKYDVQFWLYRVEY